MIGVTEMVMREATTVYVIQVPQTLFMVTLTTKIIEEDTMMVKQTVEQIAEQKKGK